MEQYGKRRPGTRGMNHGVWAAAKRTAQRIEGWVKGKAVAGSKKIFFFNLKSKLEQIDEARGMVNMYVDRVRESAERLNETVTEKPDERAVYHAQTACLVLASFRVLTNQLRLDPNAAIVCIRQCLGDSDSIGEKAVAEAGNLSCAIHFHHPLRVVSCTEEWTNLCSRFLQTKSMRNNVSEPGQNAPQTSYVSPS